MSNGQLGPQQVPFWPPRLWLFCSQGNLQNFSRPGRTASSCWQSKIYLIRVKVAALEERISVCWSPIKWSHPPCNPPISH